MMRQLTLWDAPPTENVWEARLRAAGYDLSTAYDRGDSDADFHTDQSPRSRSLTVRLSESQLDHVYELPEREFEVEP